MTRNTINRREGPESSLTVSPFNLFAIGDQWSGQATAKLQALPLLQNFVMLFDVLNTGLAVADMDGNILTMNRVALKLFGLYASGEASQTVQILSQRYLLYDSAGRLLALDEGPMPRALRGEFLSHLELRVVHNDSGDCWYGDFSAMPVYEDSETQTCQIMAIVVFQDITERVRAEAKLRRLNSENTRLHRFAVQANEVRDDFISVAGHELKTPIVGLRLYTKLLSDTLDSPDIFKAASVRDSIHALDEESTKLLQLVNRMLDATQMDGKQIMLNRRKIDLAELARGVIATAKRSQQRGRLQIALSAPESLMACVDPVRIEQVIINLLDNAIKYSPYGGTIEIALTAPDAQTACLTVTDHGVGIAPEHRDHIFGRFYQGHTHANFGGLGLGLYLSHEIVTLHGGQIKAEFPEESGTRIVVGLPIMYGPA